MERYEGYIPERAGFRGGAELIEERVSFADMSSSLYQKST
jgi:hypothetical protein